MKAQVVLTSSHIVLKNFKQSKLVIHFPIPLREFLNILQPFKTEVPNPGILLTFMLSLRSVYRIFQILQANRLVLRLDITNLIRQTGILTRGESKIIC